MSVRQGARPAAADRVEAPAVSVGVMCSLRRVKPARSTNRIVGLAVTDSDWIAARNPPLLTDSGAQPSSKISR